MAKNIGVALPKTYSWRPNIRYSSISRKLYGVAGRIINDKFGFDGLYFYF